MKGGIVWYLLDHASTVPRLLDACAGVSVTLAHHTTGRITYLDDRAGHEGDRVDVGERDLVELLRHRLGSGNQLAFQLWSDPVNDLVCVAAGKASWGAYCFSFDLDGYTPGEGMHLARRLLRARTSLDDITMLWLEDRVGMTAEFGPPHMWDGTQAPAWPVPPPAD